MKIPAIKPEWVLYGVGVGLLALFVRGLLDLNNDGRPDGVFGGLGLDVGSGISGFGGGIAEGVSSLPAEVVLGIGRGLFGVDPRSEESKRLCAASLARGEDGPFSDAGIHCPAATFFGGWFDGN